MDRFIGSKKKKKKEKKIVALGPGSGIFPRNIFSEGLLFRAMFLRDMDFSAERRGELAAQRNKFNDLDKKLPRSPTRALLLFEPSIHDIRHDERDVIFSTRRRRSEEKVVFEWKIHVQKRAPPPIVSQRYSLHW